MQRIYNLLMSSISAKSRVLYEIYSKEANGLTIKTPDSIETEFVIALTIKHTRKTKIEKFLKLLANTIFILSFILSWGLAFVVSPIFYCSYGHH